MDRMARMVGLGGSSSEEKSAPAPKGKPATRTASKPKDDKKQPSKQTTTAATNPGAIRPKTEAAPAPAEQQTAATQPAAPSQPTINGAQAPVPTGSFDNRFGAWR
jgi:hypothetical protein